MTFTDQQLKATFDSICDPLDWKAPIDGYCKIEDMEIVYQAIKHHTGTQATFLPASRNRMRVISEGYRNGPCGDY
jgi:hypothetical protein